MADQNSQGRFDPKEAEEIFWSDKVFELEWQEMHKLVHALPSESLPRERRILISNIEDVRTCLQAEPTEGTLISARMEEYRFRKYGITTYFPNLWRYLRNAQRTQIQEAAIIGRSVQHKPIDDLFNSLVSLYNTSSVPESVFRDPESIITNSIRQLKYNGHDDYSRDQWEKAQWALMTFFERTMERELTADISEENREQKQGTMKDLWDKVYDQDERNHPPLFRRLMALDNPYQDKEFLESVLDLDLKKFADGLTEQDFPLVIDCGHVDSYTMVPGFTDFRTFEDGILLMNYLRTQGHDDVRLGILFNEMPMLDITGRTIARRDIRKLRQDAKNKGMHFFAEVIYGNILRNLLVTPDQWPNLIDHIFEGNVALQCRQDMDAYKAGRNPFKVDQISFSEAGSASYDIPKEETFAEKESCGIDLTTPKGAPKCTFLSARINKRYQDQGNGAVLYLRDIKWGCAVNGGATNARRLYGVTIPIYLGAYMFVDPKNNTKGVRARVQNVEFRRL